MNVVKCLEICTNSSEDRQCPGHLQRAAQGHDNARQLKERRNQALKKQLPSTEGKNGLFLEPFNDGILNRTLRNSIKKPLAHNDLKITQSYSKTKSLPISRCAASHVVWRQECLKPQILKGCRD
ncbi:hypothetical protein EXN66_Car020454 [Channa argus]|uniref:Uncharacterized protein n=1 Tax=Channa argus TaxID=215402 RepID=A0A6G1QQK1_CHAAH|nr:hypothetical protein EXN66_Car020454 [Channa argus]